jgi:protein TonB
MESSTEPVKRRLPPALSFVLHLSLLAFVVALGARTAGRVIRPVEAPVRAMIEISGGSHAIPVKLPPMPNAAHTRQPTPETDASRRTIIPVQQPQPKRSGGGSPLHPHSGDGSSTALRGNGADAEDARPAFPVFSPRPPVTDRSLLPASEQKIVVDVNVDASGEVVSENLVKGLGNRLDQIVLDIVKTWRFQPATINGKPVPTQAELIFPFNPSYPISDS